MATPNRFTSKAPSPPHPPSTLIRINKFPVRFVNSAPAFPQECLHPASSTAYTNDVGPLRRATPDTLTADLAASDGLRQALRFFSRERAWINAQHLELCRIPAPTFFEQKRAAWMLEQFRSMGADAKIDRAGNVICFPYGDPGGPLIAVTAHLDTVLAPRQNDDIRIGPDGKFYGPGVADNGAGLTGLLGTANTTPITTTKTTANTMKKRPRSKT